MFLLILFIILAIVYSLLFNLIPLSPWFLFLWIPCGIICSFITVLLMIVLFLILCPKNNPRGKVRHFLLRNVCFIAILFNNIRIIVEGKENIPDNNTKFVIYANHKSLMDPIMLYYATGVRLTAIGKKSIFKTKLLQIIQKVFDAISLDRDNDREAAKTMVVAIKKVKEGLPMIIFPEGGIKTREVEEMSGLRAGAYKLATKAGVLIQPVSIVGATNLSKQFFMKRKKIKIIYHKPITQEEYKSMNTTEIGLMVEEIINSGIKNG